MPCVNAEAIYNNISRMIAYNKKYIALWDNDEEGILYHQKAIKSFGALEKNKFLLLPNPSRKRKVRMEEMFEKDDFKKLSAFLEMPENSSYSNIMTTLICGDDTQIKECKKVISNKANKNFDELQKMIEKVYNVNKNKELQHS